MDLSIPRHILFKRTSVVFILCNVLSLVNIIVPISPGALVALLCVFLILLYSKTLLYFFSQKENSLFILYCLSQAVSLIYLAITPVSYNFLTAHPTLFLESTSYILIPQVFFYFLGFMSGKIGTADKNVERLYWITFWCLAFSLYLHFFKPAFYQNYIDNAFDGIFDTQAILPRLNGYFSSMILGMLCSLNFVLTFKFIKNYKTQMLMIFFLIVVAILIFQRGAWLSIGLASVIMVSFNLKRYFFQRYPRFSLSKLKVVGVYILFLAVASFLLIYFAIKFDLFSLFTFDLVERLTNPGDAVAERSFLWDNTIDLLKRYPYGIGFGMLTHKAADLNFKYAVPDGNYFRIVGESGFVSLAIFSVMSLLAVYKLYMSDRKFLSLGLLLFLVQAIGTNVFDLYYCSFIFWFILGISFSKNYIKLNGNKEGHLSFNSI